MYNVSLNLCVGCGICESLSPEGMGVKDGMAGVKDQSAEGLEKALKACPQNAITNIKEELYIAIGTDDSETVKQDDHFGMSRHFMIYRFSDNELVYLETRDNVKYAENEGRIHGDPGKAKATSSVLTNVDVIVGRMFGPNIVRLRNKYVCAVVRVPQIEMSKELIKQNINEVVEEYRKDNRRGIILR